MRLSSSLDDLRPHYEVVVVGSGYGGGITASRLARAGRSVCVLERGKEFQPGEYPDQEHECLAEFQVDSPKRHIGGRSDLYDMRLNEHVNVFVGCGLGGTSLVNAGVALRAEDRVFDDPAWPAGLRADVQTRLAEGYRRAEEMLKPSVYPEAFPQTSKLTALERAARAMGASFKKTPINVNFDIEGTNHVGVEQHVCNLCGDCASGCNFGAKNTVLMNYLPDAHNHGAEIFTEISVRHVERRGAAWAVHYHPLGTGRERFDGPTMVVTADVVVLAAGTLGSTEILLRTAEQGLPLSSRVGYRFSGNGDVVGFAYNCDAPLNAIGNGLAFGHRDKLDPVGPCIAGYVDLRDGKSLADASIIEEGSIPGSLSAFLSGLFAMIAAKLGKDTDAGAGDKARELGRALTSLVRGAYHGAMRNTLTLFSIGHDDSGGRMHLVDDRLRIDWPGIGDADFVKAANEKLHDITKALGGTYVCSPLWSDLMDYDLVSVHPLGGCVMAEDASGGVVNHKGQVFSGNEGSAVHDGLYVSDGSIVPRSLGVNPLLTISAIAERNVALLAADRNWSFTYDLPSHPKPAPPGPQTIGLRFAETMHGFVSTVVLDDYTFAEDAGKRDGSTCRFVVSVSTDDLDRLIEEPEHEAKLLGTVEIPVLEPEPMMVADGRWNCFVIDADTQTRRMEYRMRLEASSGAEYFFSGYKVIRDDFGVDMWRDTTTLFVTVHRGRTDHDPVVAKGVVELGAVDLTHCLQSMRVLGARSQAERWSAKIRFIRWFMGVVADVYAGLDYGRSPAAQHHVVEV